MRKIPKNWLQAQPGRLGPAWRSLLASEMAGGALPRCPDDDMLTAAAHFLQHRAHDPTAAAAAHPLIDAAYDLHTDYEVVAQLKILVAGRVDLSQITELTGLASDVLGSWEKLFFDIRGQDQAMSWLVRHIIVPEQDSGNFEFASQLKLAITHGPDVARKIVAGTVSALDVSEDTFQELRLKLQMKTAFAFHLPVKAAESFQWVKLTATVKLAEQRLALEEKKLAKRQEIALKKLELIEHQLAEKSAARAEREAVRQRVDRWRYHQEVHFRQQQEEDRRTRIAASPLAQLRWKRGNSEVILGPASSSVLPLVSPPAGDLPSHLQDYQGTDPRTPPVPTVAATNNTPFKLSA
jgi:hypothetical protein